MQLPDKQYAQKIKAAIRQKNFTQNVVAVSVLSENVSAMPANVKAAHEKIMDKTAYLMLFFARAGSDFICSIFVSLASVKMFIMAPFPMFNLCSFLKKIHGEISAAPKLFAY